MAKIGIDPGHGGFDPGAIGQMGTREKDVTLGVSLQLAKLLRDNGLEVVLTRDTDREVGSIRDVNQELWARTNLLNNAKVDLPISIHVNSSLNHAANYISTFILAPGGEAEKLAKCVQPKLVAATGWPDGGIRTANLHMLRQTVMPAILVECGFISNLEQEKQLRLPEMQEKIAQGIAEGVLDYLGIEGEIKMQEVKVIVKDKEITGKLVDGVTYVPLRELIEMLNNKIVWDGEKKVARVE